MKKVLLGTSAIALAGAFVTPAAAAEWDVAFGGYMEQYVAFASSDFDNDNLGICKGSSCWDFGGDYDGVDSKQDAEVHFKPSITLDNGMKIGVDIQLEGNTSGDQVDESYMYIRGSFGEINLGSENSAGYKMQYIAPDVTFVGVNSGSLPMFFPLGFTSDFNRNTLGSTTVEVQGNNDAQRFTYYTPRFAGFQVGVSYARDGRQDDNTQIDTGDGDGWTTPELHDIFDIAANYVNTFGDINIAASGRYGQADIAGESDNPKVWAAGLNLGYAGFTIGGSYAKSWDTNNLGDGRAWDLGVSYETGPWGFSFTYFNGRNQDNLGSSSSDDEDLDQYLAGVTYKMAKGVTLMGFGAYVDYEDDYDYADMDGWVIGTGIKVSF